MYFKEKMLTSFCIYCLLFNVGHYFQYFAVMDYTAVYIVIYTSLYASLMVSFMTLIFQFSSVTQSCPTLCDPMNHSTPGLPVHHQLSEFTQTHVHQVGHAIQPSHPLSSPSPPAPNPSQLQGLYQQ